jgi:hypothetical protein
MGGGRGGRGVGLIRQWEGEVGEWLLSLVKSQNYSHFFLSVKVPTDTVLMGFMRIQIKNTVQ